MANENESGNYDAKMHYLCDEFFHEMNLDVVNVNGLMRENEPSHETECEKQLEMRNGTSQVDGN